MPADDTVAAAEMVGTSAQCRPAALCSGYLIPVLSWKRIQMGPSPARYYKAAVVSDLRVQQTSLLRQISGCPARARHICDQVAQRGLNLKREIRLGKKRNAPWQVSFCDARFARGDKGRHLWPTVLDESSEQETIHRARYLNIGEHRPDIVAGLEDAYRLVGIGYSDRLKARGFDRRYRVQSLQCLVFHDKNGRL